MLDVLVPEISLDCSGGNASVDELITGTMTKLVGMAIEGKSRRLAEFGHDL